MNIDIINMMYALGIGGAVGAVGGYVGSLMVTKRMALTGGALGHLTLPGIALALHYGIDVSLGALIFLSLGIVLIWLLQQTTDLPAETLIAITFSSSLAVAFLFLPEKETQHALLGNISGLTPAVFLITICSSLGIFLGVKMLYKKLVLMSVSLDIARVEGINVRLVQFLFLLFIAFIIALGVRIIGGLMTAALVAIPASSSRLISFDLKSYRFFSLLFGASACVVGILASSYTLLPVGSLIIISSAVIFLLCFLRNCFI